MAPGRRELTNTEHEAILRESLMRSNGTFMTKMPKGLSSELAAKSCFLLRLRALGTRKTAASGGTARWPFTTLAAGQRSSANRSAGTLETKTVNVTKDVYRNYLLEKVLSAIVRKWPGDTRDIILQHDKAKTHVTVSEKRLQQSFDTYKSAGWTFRLEPQPPNSPDFNVLDLGFFAALQSLQHRRASGQDRTSMTLQACLLEAMKVHGDNIYKIPHLSKEMKQQHGMLGRNVELHADAAGMLQTCDREAMDAACAAELTDLREMDELSRVLEEMTLGGDDHEDLAHALVEVGIDAIDLSSSDTPSAVPPAHKVTAARLFRLRVQKAIDDGKRCYQIALAEGYGGEPCLSMLN
ncbi:hypothetical protein H257_18563 [Aphanomyces astaci]|uniref:Uncharacterized protein n=1 Tax=Aphanomyces astaci TaxID=112090 RepID=W4FCF1_APHAT|nr:hypothetical protein H257_18563 [Aphanomyces astaci]ETV64559.1 hypothetical protein H257_18563 [Aphanomyces astaci]|eukprot:XP_009845956.1 hypothetical protein H257_18563 [Aphanomyces astaci]